MAGGGFISISLCYCIVILACSVLGLLLCNDIAVCNIR
jgi:hypothetical protein